MPVNLVEYNPEWRRLFAEQRDRLAVVLGPWLAKPVEHVGSTAVPGLSSKPIVDVLASVTSLIEAQEAIPILDENGWLHWPTDPNESWRMWFLRPRPEARTHHLYLVQHDDPHACELRAFRDVLRTNEQLRNEYQSLKAHLAQAFRDDREAYTAAKGTFIANTLKQIGLQPQRRN
ncbi:GrpB family protein [Mycobacterium sp. 2YAF39]|uniref:GrpB family protein n=1 Tax=Mycobacterium sp. 2YAF39 TaxID=3233033 RepID=UPI003F9DD82D